MVKTLCLIDSIIYAVSILGLICSIILTILGGIVFPLPLSNSSQALAQITVLSLVPVSFLFILCYQHLTSGYTQKEIEKFRYNGCPKWMRVATYSFVCMGIFLFLLPIGLELNGHAPASDGAFFSSTLPGGFGLMAYSSIFSQLFSLKAMAKNHSKETSDDSR